MMVANDFDYIAAQGRVREWACVSTVIFELAQQDASLPARELGLIDENGERSSIDKSFNNEALSTLMARLFEMVRVADLPRRYSAIRAIGEAAKCCSSVAVESETCLIELISDEIEDTRISTLRALGRMGSNASPRLVDALISHLRERAFDSDPVVIELLKTMQTCTALAASRGIPELLKLLARNEIGTQVRITVCETLAWLGPLALEAVPDLFRILVGKPALQQESGDQAQTDSSNTHTVPNSSIAAVLAVMRIDPDGTQVVALASDLEELVRFRELLTTMNGLPERNPVGNLIREIARREIGPPEGFRRMRMEDIRGYIFGINTPQTVEARQTEEDGKRSLDNRRKKIEGWLKNKKLRGMRIKLGYYDVDAGDLATLRNLHLGHDPLDDN